MWKSIALQITLILCSVAAAFISFNLLAKHLTGTPGPAWFEFGCSTATTEASKFNCNAVVNSPYGYFPPLTETTGTQSLGKRYPVAFLGMVYYSALTVWFLLVGRPSRSRRWAHLIPLTMVALGLCGSAYYIWVMASKLDQWCPWCLVTHGLNLIIALAAFFLWPFAPKTPEEETPPITTTRPLAKPLAQHVPIEPSPYPGWRMVLAGIAAMLGVAYGQNEFLGKAMFSSAVAQSKAGFDTCQKTLRNMLDDPDRLYRMWDVVPVKQVAVRADDPVKLMNKSADNAWELILFSDFECPSCKQTAAFLEQKINPLFQGRIRTVFKHFPLDQSCNPNVSSTLHPEACKAARIAEAARLQGGNDAFWRIHDLLFNSQKQGVGLRGLDPAVVARAAGLDPAKLQADMDTAAVMDRMKEDFNLAKSIGLTHTPYAILNGKPVDGPIFKEIGFWDKVADTYWHSIGVERPASAKLPPPATPSTPNPKASP